MVGSLRSRAASNAASEAWAGPASAKTSVEPVQTMMPRAQPFRSQEPADVGAERLRHRLLGAALDVRAVEPAHPLRVEDGGHRAACRGACPRRASTRW